MIRASDFECLFGGRRADNLHHDSGRDAAGAYLDEDQRVPLSLVQHGIEHACWNALGIGDGADLPAHYLRMRRSSHLLVRVGEHHAGGLVTLPAFYLVELGLSHQRIADDLWTPL